MAQKRGKGSFSFDTKILGVRILWSANQKVIKIGNHWLLNWKFELSEKAGAELLAKVNAVVMPLHCIATELGPNTVGVQGDGRVYWPSVYVSFPASASLIEIAFISNKIINEVPGISKILMNLTASC